MALYPLKSTRILLNHLLHDSHLKAIYSIIENQDNLYYQYYWIEIENGKIMTHQSVKEIIEFHFYTSHFYFYLLFNHITETFVLREKKYNANTPPVKSINSLIELTPYQIDFLHENHIDLFNPIYNELTLFHLNFKNS